MTRKGENNGALDGWASLRLRRQEAAAYRLNILIWGSGENAGREFKMRCQLRDVLVADGHDAQFSEDLCRQPGALDNPIDDEQLQAEEAHLIIMFYGSRGTQTERDIILSHQHIASKAIVFIENDMFAAVRRSLSGKSWDEMGQVARIIKYKKSDIPKRVIELARDLTQQIRMATYVRNLRRGILNGK